jgi:hypothetical protein
MPEEQLEQLPELATYVGFARDFQHLRGIYFKTADAEALVYIGERENIEVEFPNGDKHCPWRHVYAYQVDANGDPIVPPHEPIVERGPRAMSRADLASLGYTDARLAELARDLLGESWEPDRSGPSDARRAMFDRVMSAVYG